MRLGLERDYRLKDPEIVHQLDQRDEDHERHQMRYNHMHHTLPVRGTVDPGGLHRVFRHGLETGVEDDETEG